MKITRKMISHRRTPYRVQVLWRGYGYDRDFETAEEAEAYELGLYDARQAILVDWQEDDE